MKTRSVIVLSLCLVAPLAYSSNQDKPLPQQEGANIEIVQPEEKDGFDLSEDIRVPFDKLASQKPEEMDCYRAYWIVVQHIKLNGYEYIFGITEDEAVKRGVSKEHYAKIKQTFDKMTEDYRQAEMDGYIVYPYDPETFVKNMKEKYQSTTN